MKAILAICSEYSDDVWYSGQEVDSKPQKIAIEIERRHCKALLKALSSYNYQKESIKRIDDRVCILKLNQAQPSMLC